MLKRESSKTVACRFSKKKKKEEEGGLFVCMCACVWCVYVCVCVFGDETSWEMLFKKLIVKKNMLRKRPMHHEHAPCSFEKLDVEEINE
jgi:hypothetical protein